MRQVSAKGLIPGAATPTRSRTHQALLDAIERVRKDGVVTIAAVAREVGVSTSLIHNRYHDVAETIRALGGKTKRDALSAASSTLARERDSNRALRAANSSLLMELRALASVNESLRRQLAFEQAKSAPNVVPLYCRTSQSDRMSSESTVEPPAMDPSHRA